MRLNERFRPVSIARFLGTLSFLSLIGSLPLKGQGVVKDSLYSSPIKESGSVSPFSYELEGEAADGRRGAAKRGSKSAGDITEIRSAAGIVLSAQLNRQSLLRLGFQWQRYSFDPDP